MCHSAGLKGPILLIRSSMADQGRWFKLWYTALQDTELVSLGPAGFGRWCMLGAYTKTHGNHGTVTINQDDRVFLAMMDLTPENVTVELQKMPHLDVLNCNGKITVTFKRWTQYQEDHTVKERVRRHRSKPCNGDKKRREESTPIVPKFPSHLDTPDFKNAWSDLIAYRKQKRNPMTQIGVTKLINKLEKWGPVRAVSAINHSIASGWTGVYEDTKDQQGKSYGRDRQADHNQGGTGEVVI